ARVGTVHLVKSIEDVRQLLGADALAGVAYDQLHVLAGGVQVDVDTAAGRRDLHGVGDEVRDDRVQTVAVAEHDGVGLDGRLRQQGGRVRILRRRRQDLPDDGRQVDRPRLQLDLAGDDSRDVEEVVDQARLHARVAVDRGQRGEQA